MSYETMSEKCGRKIRPVGEVANDLLQTALSIYGRLTAIQDRLETASKCCPANEIEAPSLGIMSSLEDASDVQRRCQDVLTSLEQMI